MLHLVDFVIIITLAPGEECEGKTKMVLSVSMSCDCLSQCLYHRR